MEIEVNRNQPTMDKQSALRALQVIDSVICSTDRKELCSGEFDELQSACASLMCSVKNNAIAAEKAAWMVEVIQAALIGKRTNLYSSREAILDCGTSLALLIEGLPGSVHYDGNLTLP